MVFGNVGVVPVGLDVPVPAPDGKDKPFRCRIVVPAVQTEFDKIINVKVRSTGRLLKAKLNFLDNLAEVEILEKETGISPGQACVFYSKDEVGDKVMGGGWINKTFNNYLST